ncbi:MAG: SPOR domain-containing protein [Bacteroidales bacterium]
MKMHFLKMLIGGCFLLLIGSNKGYAQYFPNTSENQNQGSLKINASPSVDSLLSLHKSMNDKYPSIPGCRIEIFFDSGNNSKKKAKEVYDKFLKDYPEQTAYISFFAPNYRVRVGDFRSKLEAENFLRKIKKEYPGAWIASDKINYPSMGEKKIKEENKTEQENY